MYRTATIVALSLLASVRAQQIGTSTAESHPKLTVQKCTKSGGCAQSSASITLDANWRWLHNTAGYTNCYTGNKWDSSFCPDGKTCAQNCALDGADYSGTYGITTSGDALTLKFVTGSNVGSRVYLMDSSDSKYELFKLKGKEFAMDVDMSNLGCGLNGAVYLVEMDADGGMSKYPTNKAGAKYGTGYCDSQCPHDIKFIGGVANIEGWNGTSANSGSGKLGACCAEMDIWEANKNAAAYTPHPCSGTGLTACTGTDCGDGDNRYGGVCDKDGCDFNSWRMGDQTFLGPGKTVDTSRKFTLVTQFITTDGTTSGDLSEIRRLYVQDGKVIQNSQSKIASAPGNSITDSFCAAQKTAFSDNNYFATKGGLKGMGGSLDRGMVLALSIWDDYSVNMLWLDSTYPTNKDPSAPGVSRGPCAVTSGKPQDIETSQASDKVTYSNIRWGDIGSTYTGTSSSSTTTGNGGSTSTTTTRGPSSSTTTTTKAPTPTGTVPQWGQCGGLTYTGPTVCQSPYTCHKQNDYYSQCY